MPNLLIARALILRGARLWVLTRLALSLALLFGEVDPLHLTGVGVAQIVVVATFAGFVESHRRRERALLGNLGVSRGWLVPFYALPAVAGEAIFATLIRSVS